MTGFLKRDLAGDRTSRRQRRARRGLSARCVRPRLQLEILSCLKRPGIRVRKYHFDRCSLASILFRLTSSAYRLLYELRRCQEFPERFCAGNAVTKVSRILSVGDSIACDRRYAVRSGLIRGKGTVAVCGPWPREHVWRVGAFDTDSEAKALAYGCLDRARTKLAVNRGNDLRREGERQPPRLSPSTTLKATLRCSPSLMKQWRPHDRERQMPNKKGALLCAPFSLVT